MCGRLNLKIALNQFYLFQFYLFITTCILAASLALLAIWGWEG